MFPQTPRMPQLSHSFAKVPNVHVPRSVFRRPYERHFTNGTDYLYPFYVEEVIPGDTHMLRGRFLSRLTTPIVPFMSNLYLETFFFFVPNRLVWNNWQRFMGERDPNPDSSIDYTLPLMYRPSSGGWTALSLQDYLNYGNPGVDGDDTSAFAAHNLVGRAHNLIYNDFFRDENLIDSIPVDLDDGPDDPADYVLRKRGKRHDYFTAALPWPQKGEAVPLVIAGQAPVYGNDLSTGNGNFYADGANAWQGISATVGTPTSFGTLGMTTTTSPYEVDAATNAASGTQTTSEWGQSTVVKGLSLATEAQYDALNEGISTTPDQRMYAPPFADMSAVEAGTINDFRFAFQLQMLLENDARGGTRYVELLLVQYGVVSPDFRLQRPEYLGGGRQNLQMVTVPQTSETDGTEQGNLAAYALFHGGHHGFSKSFVEHGYIIGLMNIRTDLSYQQGQPRHYGRRTRYDFYFPAFAHLGEQVVYNRELFEGTDAVVEGQPFGYQEYGAEYRYKPSEIVGAMRSDYATSLDVWHLSQQFSSQPTLGQTFIEEAVPISRVTGVESEHEYFKTDFFAEIRSARPLPVYSVPGLITRL